jgi:hypothetical protein
MEVENQEGQGPLWAVAPLMMMTIIMIFEADFVQGCSDALMLTWH